MFSNASTVFLVVFFLVFILLVLASAWLWGRGWFIVTLAALGGALVSSEVGGKEAPLDVHRLLEIGGLLLLFLVFSYFVGSRHLTKTKWSDMTYQSHAALVRYLNESRLTSPFATAMRAMGPVLLVLVLLYAGVAAWAKLTGRIS